jgi:CDP-diacylglycerol---glycerol-3-phosphate 3-phosphatidyltransferase
VTQAFGPSALATPANAVTATRVAVTPLLLVWIAATGASWGVFALWTALSFTDGIDGYLARRHGTTTSGAFLDPLADKLLVLGAMATLVVEGRLWWLPVALIGLREVAMSVYRWVAAGDGVSLPARRSAKVKTVSQEVAVGLALAPLTADHLPRLAGLVLWVAVALTVLSGGQYLVDARRRLDAV